MGQRVGLVRWTVQDSNPGRGKIFSSSSKPSRPALGSTQPLFSGYQISIPAKKRLGREIDHSFPSSAEVKNVWSYTAASHIRLHGENDNCTFIHLLPAHRNILNMLKPISLWH